VMSLAWRKASTMRFVPSSRWHPHPLYCPTSNLSHSSVNASRTHGSPACPSDTDSSTYSHAARPSKGSREARAVRSPPVSATKDRGYNRGEMVLRKSSNATLW
jgi:hypothetical protein